MSLTNEAANIDENNFKDAVALYVKLHDEITASSRAMRDLKKQKVELGDTILAYMRDRDIEAFQMTDGKLKRSQSKRTEGIKKEHYIDTLKAYCTDPAACEAAYIEMCNRRKVEVKDALKRTKARGNTS